MNLTISNENGLTLAVAEGRLDTVSAPEFEKMMQPLMADDVKNVIIDCAGISYIASSGLRLFLTLQKHAMAKKTSLTLRGMKPDIKNVFDMTGLSKFFNI